MQGTRDHNFITLRRTAGGWDTVFHWIGRWLSHLNFYWSALSFKMKGGCSWLPPFLCAKNEHIMWWGRVCIGRKRGSEVVIRASIRLDNFELLSGNLTATFVMKISR